VARPFSSTLAATGGMTAYQWMLAAGTLPAGLALNPATGAITGTPTIATGPAGTSLTVRVTDALGATADKLLTLTIN
jgi:hypothetical protein